MQPKNIIKKYIDTSVFITKNAKGFKVYQFNYKGKPLHLSYRPIKTVVEDYYVHEEGYSDGIYNSEYENLNNTGNFDIIIVGVGFKYFNKWEFRRTIKDKTKTSEEFMKEQFTNFCKALKAVEKATTKR